MYEKLVLKRNVYILNKYFNFEISGIASKKSLKEILSLAKSKDINEFQIDDEINPAITVYFGKAKMGKGNTPPKITKNNGTKIEIKKPEDLKTILIYTPKNALLEFTDNVI